MKRWCRFFAALGLALAIAGALSGCDPTEKLRPDEIQRAVHECREAGGFPEILRVHNVGQVLEVYCWDKKEK